MRTPSLLLPGLRILALAAFLAAVPRSALAQSGYNPEFLGNAAPAPRTGFSPKIFLDYFNQDSISGNDVEVAVEPQYWFLGFSGDGKKDWLQVVVHIPFGYRSQTVAGTNSSTWSLGTISANVESFVNLSRDGTTWWFDNGLSLSLPTATGTQGLRIGGNAFGISWYQENYVQVGRWILSVSPISVGYTFRDSSTGMTPGLSLNVLNSAYGYQVSDAVSLGVTTAFLLGNLAGTDDGFGGTLPVTQRLYVGPAASFSFPNDMSIQASVLVDVYTRNLTRGQGVAVAFWHMF